VKAKSTTDKKNTTAPATTISWTVIAVFLFSLSVLLYANTIGHGYTVDDGTVIENNRFTTQGLNGLDDIFGESYRAGFWDRKEGLYRPLSVALFAIEWELAPEQPWLGHLINILLYAACSVILFTVLRRLLQNTHPFIPLFATLLWIVHPLHTEVVANIKSRDELLSFFFGMLSLRLLFQSVDRRNTLSLILAACSFILALLSKENAVTWAGVFPLALWCFTELDIRKLITKGAVFLGVVAFYFGIRMAILGEIGGGYELMVINNSLAGTTDPMIRLATSFLIIGKYMLLFLFPVSLSFDYSYNTFPLVGFSNIGAILSLLIILFGVFTALRTLPQRSALSFSILFSLGTFVLVSNVFLLIEATMAERFLFTPSLGLCMLVAVLTDRLLKTGNKSAEGIPVPLLTHHRLFLPTVVILVLLGARSFSRNMDWKDNLTLLEHDVKVSPNSARIRYALGSAYLIEKALKEPEGSPLKNGYLDKAIRELSAGVSILPNYNEAWYHLGLAYKEKGNALEAVKALETARAYKSFTDAPHLTASGLAYGLNTQYDKALVDLKEVCRLTPDDADAWNNYGLYLTEAGQINEAVDALDKAIALRKDFGKAFYNKGNTFAKAGNFRIALEQYKKALLINPNYTDALNNSGNCHIMLQNTDSALYFFQRALSADPTNTKAMVNLAVTLQNRGDTAAARPYIEQARAAGAIR
jgi:tetratricopeptide (TPR) repeat protein